MGKYFYKTTGTSLILGSTIAITSMALHPSGGSIERIIYITKSLKIIHSLAIFCLPIILFGFYGLTYKLLDKSNVSIFPLIIIAFGLFAAMFAALLNGLVLPYFLSQYSENIEQNISILKPIMNYSFAINIVLDYIFIVSCCLSITIYSIITIGSHKLPKWIGYFGIAILLFAIIGATTNFVFTNLIGFRTFIFSIASWILSAGVLLIQSKNS